MQDNSSLLTIVLTLKDRTLFTYRWMNWMNESRCPYKILIADGGKDKDVENHLKNYENYTNLNYEYVRYPYDENISMFFNKHENIVSKVDTKYVIMQADNDDFFILDGIKKSIDFLENNDDFIGCGGYAYYFILRDKEKIEDMNAHIKGNKIEFFRENFSQTCFLHEKALDRVACFLEQSAESTAWYNVYKTDVTQKVLKGIVKNDFVNFDLQERYIYLSYSSHGKIKLIETPYLTRQSNTSSNNSLDTRVKNRLYLLLKSREYYNGIHNIVEDISGLVSGSDNLNVSDVFETIEDKVIDYYRRTIFCPSCCDNVVGIKYAFLNKFRDYRLYAMLRTIYHNLNMSSKVTYENLNKASNFELKKIETFIKNY